MGESRKWATAVTATCFECGQIKSRRTVSVAALQLLARGHSALRLLKLRRHGRLRVKLRINFTNLRQRRAGRESGWQNGKDDNGTPHIFCATG